MQKINKFKLSLILFFLIWISFSAIYIPHNFNRAHQSKEDRVLKTAKTSAVALGGEMLKELNALPGDVNTLSYLSLKARLKDIAEVDQDIIFSYLMIKKNDTIYFLVDSEPIDSTDYSAPGDIFYEADEQIYQAFASKNAFITKPTADRWGNWVSVLVPILNEENKVVAVFGNDYSAVNWKKEAYASLVNSSLVSFFVLLLIVLLYLIDKNRRSFKNLSFNYQRINDNIADVIWTADLQFNLSYVSPSITQIFGDEPGQHLSRRIEEKFPPNSLMYLRKTLNVELKKEARKNIDKDRSLILELEHYRADKSTFWAEMSVKFIRNKQGKAIGLQGITRDISERKKLMHQLEDSEEKFRLISENSPVVVFQFVPNKKGSGHFNYISSQVKKVTGFKKNDFLKNYPLIHQRITASYLKNFETELKKVVSNEKRNFKFIMEFKRLDNQVVWLELKAVASRQKDDTLVLNGVFIDITKQKELEHQLISETARLNHVIEGANIGTWEHNIENKELRINDKWVNILGYSSNDLQLNNIKDWFELIYPEDLNGFKQALDKHLSLKSGYFECEFRMTHKNNSLIWVFVKGKLVSFADKKEAVWLFGTLQDINDRKKIEEDLLKITKSVEQSPTSIVITNPQGDIEYVNPKFQDLTGYSLKEAIGQNPRILKSGQTSDIEYQKLWQTISSGKVWRGEFHNKKKNGEFFWEAASISPVTNDQGKIINYVAIKEDITKQKNNSEALKKSEEQYKTMVANIPGATFRCKVDKKWTMMYISDYIFKISGFKSQDLINNRKLSFSDLILKDDRSYVEREIKKAAKAGSHYEIEYRIIDQQGELKWLKEKAKIIKENKKALFLDGIIYNITQEKKLHDEILDSKKRYDDLARQSKTFIWEVDSKANYTYVSENVYDILGYRASDLINKKSVFDLHPKENLQEFKKNVLVVLKNKETIKSLENPVVAKDGSIVWVSSSGIPIVNNQGQLVKFVGSDMDISEKKNIQEKINQSLKQQSFLSQISSKLAQYTNLDKTINEVLKEILSFTKMDRVYIFQDSLDGEYTQNTFEVCAPRIKAQINNLQNVYWKDYKAMYSQLKNKHIFKVENIENLDSAERKFLAKQNIKSILAVPLRLAKRQIGFIGLDSVKKIKNWQKNDLYLIEMIARSVSSVLEREDNTKQIISGLNEAKTEREKIETIVQGIGDGVFVLNKNLEIILFNQQASNISGFSREEVINKKYSEVLKFLCEKSGQRKDDFIKQAFATGKIQKMANHTLLIKKDGEKVAVSDSSAPIRDKDNNIIACVVVFRDVSQEREVEKIKSEFVSVVSHQLKTPLTGIKWMSELLLEDDFGKVNDEQKEFINNIYSSNQRMIKLVKDLLDVSHIETGRKFEINKKKVDIVKIVTQVLIDNAQLAKEKKVKIIKCAGAPAKLYMKVDSSKVEQVFSNLINNAIKYSKQGGQIKIACQHKKNEIVFTITDNGMGIPAKQQARIFSKFFRAENALSSETDGTGLGLYISRSIALAHGGSLWFNSEKNKGTTFFFSLPR